MACEEGRGTEQQQHCLNELLLLTRIESGLTQMKELSALLRFLILLMVFAIYRQVF